MNRPESKPCSRDAVPTDEREYPRDYHRLGADSVVAILPRQSPAPAGRRFQSLRALARRVASEPVLPVAALIFHCSRCGSTLLARLLEHDPGNRVFAEPEALPRFFAAHAEALARGEDAAELGAFIHAFGLAPAPHERHLIVKLTSRAIRYLPGFRAAFPDVPFVYLFRDPVEVVASLCANPPTFLRDDQRAAVAAELHPCPPEVARFSAVHWFAWYVDRNLRLGLQHRTRFGEVIDYSGHVTEYVDFARRLGRGRREIDSLEAALIFGRHSKNPGIVFTPANAPVLGQEQRDLVTAIAGEAFRLWRRAAK